MATVIAFQDVDDVQHWLAGPTREAVFGPLGITVRTLVDPEVSNRVGLVLEVPDMAAFQEVMASDVAAEAMKTDGVRPDTLVMLVEGQQRPFPKPAVRLRRRGRLSWLRR